MFLFFLGPMLVEHVAWTPLNDVLTGWLYLSEFHQWY